MTKRFALSALLLLLASTATAVVAQGDPNRPGPGRPQPDSLARNRAALEGQVRERITQVARQRLGLTDAQAEKLGQSNAKYADRRRTLMEQEREVRMTLRDEMIAGDSSRQRQIGELLDRTMKVQRQRVDLLEEEQRELATFLTPLQRASYFGLEEQLRQRMQQMRADGRAGGFGGPGGRGGRMRPNGPPPDGMGPDGPPPGGMARRRPPGDVPPGPPSIPQQ